MSLPANSAVAIVIDAPRRVLRAMFQIVAYSLGAVLVFGMVSGIGMIAAISVLSEVLTGEEV